MNTMLKAWGMKLTMNFGESERVRKQGCIKEKDVLDKSNVQYHFLLCQCSVWSRSCQQIKRSLTSRIEGSQKYLKLEEWVWVRRRKKLSHGFRERPNKAKERGKEKGMREENSAKICCEHCWWEEKKEQRVWYREMNFLENLEKEWREKKKTEANNFFITKKRLKCWHLSPGYQTCFPHWNVLHYYW